jgi:hypothetical protein
VKSDIFVKIVKKLIHGLSPSEAERNRATPAHFRGLSLPCPRFELCKHDPLRDFALLKKLNRSCDFPCSHSACCDSQNSVIITNLRCEHGLYCMQTTISWQDRLLTIDSQDTPHLAST